MAIAMVTVMVTITVMATVTFTVTVVVMATVEVTDTVRLFLSRTLAIPVGSSLRVLLLL